VTRAVDDADRLDLVRPASFELGVELEQSHKLPDDGGRGNQGRQAHGVEIPLARPVAEPAEVVHVTVTDHHRVHGRQGAMRAPWVERQP
jgi:hypothetical protein